MKILIPFFIATLILNSCGSNKQETGSSVIDAPQIQNSEKPSDRISEKDFADFQNDSGVPVGIGKKEEKLPSIPFPAQDWDKKIIKTASLNIEIKDYAKYNLSLRDKVKQLGGYIAQEEESQSAYKIENILTIKVPVDQFDNAISLLSAGAENVNEKKMTSQDVTGEVMDIKSRLEAKKQVRLRYLDLLKQAKNMEEILNVQSEINDIQEEIESAAGRLNYLSHSSSLSTIQLTYYQVLNAFAKDNDKPAFGTKLSHAFRLGWDWFGELFIGIISIWPLVILLFIIFIIYRRSKSVKKRADTKLKMNS
ncbi:MAG TPA: DUF4349 domain-containing protein [Chitinophagaceae bacterium]|nr:DUF4349 domain-containing protein [Chitinophagaceae bacterium]